MPARLAQCVEDEPDLITAEWYESASEAEKEHFIKDCWDYVEVLRKREAQGFHFLSRGNTPPEVLQAATQQQKGNHSSMAHNNKKPGFWSRLFGIGDATDPDRLPVEDALDHDLRELGRLSRGDAPAVDADYTVKTQPAVGPRKTTSTMTQEELRQRRTNLIESAKFGRPAHENIMLFVLKIWLILGPIAFVALTTAEIAYILTALVPPDDPHGQSVIWGGALFIDLAMMFTTFGVALKRRDLAEKREANGSVSRREEAEVWFGTGMWLLFAIINIVGQGAFLHHVVTASPSPHHDMNLLYIFIASRVVGFILGDASTAFFLAKVDNSALKLIARGEREKGALYSDIAKAEGERQFIEAEAEAKIRLVQIEVRGKEQEAEFMAQLKSQVFADILSRRTSAPELEGPNRSRLKRLDSSS